MMTRDYYILGVDVGTTATKATLFDLKGRTVAITTEEYELVTPKTLEVEVEIETLWLSFKKGVTNVLRRSKVRPENVKAIGFSVQGETLVPIAKNGRPLRRAIVWLDNRAQEEAERLREDFGDEKSYRITGQVKFVPTWPASKILWIRNHEPHVFEQAFKYLLVEDYLIWKMTGSFVSEGSLLCSTCYWNIVTKRWWDEMLDFLGITPDHLPEVREPGEKIGNLTPEIAQELGLTPETVVSTGALDNACGALGVGNVKLGIFTVNIGAALAVCSTLEKLAFNPKTSFPIHYHAIPDTYMAHTFTTGGMVLRWFRDTFYEAETRPPNTARTDTYQLIDDKVNKVEPGSEGLVMIPHLQGAMAPESDPKAKGVFFGFTLKHQKQHFARSIMEAISCVIRRNIDALEDWAIKVDEIRALGGGAKSRIWNQIIADLTRKSVVITGHVEDAACLGAAILAGKGAGIFKSVENAVEKIVSPKERFEPNPKNFKIYDELYMKYVKLYESLTELFKIN